MPDHDVPTAAPIPRYVDPSSSPPWPLAVGVLLAARPLEDDELRVERRLSLSLNAYRLGYYLLDVVEVDQGHDATASDVATWSHLERVVRRARPDALVVEGSGPVVLPEQLPRAVAAIPWRLVPT